MEQKSLIVIYKLPRNDNYYADICGKFGGGYIRAFAGATAEEAAIFAIREKGRYTTNLGCSVVAPKEVQEHIESLLGNTI